MKACKGPRVSAMPLQFGSEVQLQQSTTMFPNTLKIKIKGYFTILKLKKKTLFTYIRLLNIIFQNAIFCWIIVKLIQVRSNSLQAKFDTGECGI